MNGKYVSFFFAIKARRNEQPDLEQNYRRGHEHTGKRANLQVEIERLSRVQIDQLLGHPIAMERVHDGALHDFENTFGISPAGKEPDRNSNQRIDDAFAEFLEVIEETHRRHFIVIRCVG